MSVITKKVDALFAEWDKKYSPGCAVGIIRDGKLVYGRGYGMANLEYCIPLSTDSVFDIGSVAKQFTATCILILAIRKKLSLNDKIRKHMPELPAYTEGVTIRHLLHHSGGISDYLTLMHVAGMPLENNYSVEEVLQLLSNRKTPDFASGNETLYSNSGYFLLAEIVKRVSGERMSVFARENIFAPLSMDSTRFVDKSVIIKNRASGYAKMKDCFVPSMSIMDLVGDGGLNTSVHDLARWDINFYRNRLHGGQELINGLLTPGKLNDGTVLD